MAEKRAQVERLQDRANKFISAVGEALAPEQIKSIKETMLRLDLAIEAGNDKDAASLEGQLREQLIELDQDVELQKAMTRSHNASRSDEYGNPGRSHSHVSQDDEFESGLVIRAGGLGDQRQQELALPLSVQSLGFNRKEDLSDYPPEVSALTNPRSMDLDEELEMKDPTRDMSFSHETYDAAAKDEEFDVTSIPPPPPV
jgi:hypothetical protein